TPVSEELLGAIHARLPGSRVTGSEEVLEQAARIGGASVFPGWEFFAPVAGAGHTIFDLMPRAAVVVDEPSLVNAELDRFWERVEGAHERSGIGNLVRPQDLYETPEQWRGATLNRVGADVEHLGIATPETEGVEEQVFSSQPAGKFHGSVPAM